MRKKQTTRDRMIAALIKRCDFTLECLPEDFDPADSFDDPRDVEWAREQVNSGNEWGWCCAHVIATFEIGEVSFTGDDYLGGCSYENEKAFMVPDGYYPSMQHEACAAIANKLIAAKIAIDSLMKGNR